MDKNSVLYAPWRDSYVTSSDKKVLKNSNNCVFCEIAENKTAEDDLENKVIFRSESCFIVMNKYPYTPGHFMIIPNLHTSKLEDLDLETWQKMTKFAHQGVKLLKDVINASGVNIGMNLGKTAGAGIAEHIHLHLVPRFERDTNFITTTAHERVYSTDFEKIFNKLRAESPNYFKL